MHSSSEQRPIIHVLDYDDKVIHEHHSYQTRTQTSQLIQITGKCSEEILSAIQKDYAFDHTVFEDILNQKQRNKFEVKEDHLFATFHYDDLMNEEIHSNYLSLLLYKDALILFHKFPTRLSHDFVERLTKHTQVRQKPMDYLFYYVLDWLTDHHLDVFKHLFSQATSYEEALLENQSLNQEALYLIRKKLLRLKVNIEPIYEDFEKTLMHAKHLITSDHHLYYDDVKDHLLRLLSHLNEAREMIRHLLDLNINNQSQKMNRIMTTLTLFSAIFIPLSFLTGFFGMNFVHFELLEYEYALIGFILSCALLAVGMVILFKKMRWFD